MSLPKEELIKITDRVRWGVGYKLLSKESPNSAYLRFTIPQKKTFFGFTPSVKYYKIGDITSFPGSLITLNDGQIVHFDDITMYVTKEGEAIIKKNIEDETNAYLNTQKGNPFLSESLYKRLLNAGKISASNYTSNNTGDPMGGTHISYIKKGSAGGYRKRKHTSKSKVKKHTKRRTLSKKK